MIIAELYAGVNSPFLAVVYPSELKEPIATDSAREMVDKLYDLIDPSNGMSIRCPQNGTVCMSLNGIESICNPLSTEAKKELVDVLEGKMVMAAIFSNPL